MNNIFENAYFGKLYRTRNGSCAVYLNWLPSVYRAFERDGWNHQLFVKDACPIEPFIYKDNGEGDFANRDLDIVGCWIDPKGSVVEFCKYCREQDDCKTIIGNCERNKFFAKIANEQKARDKDKVRSIASKWYDFLELGKMEIDKEKYLESFDKVINER